MRGEQQGGQHGVNERFDTDLDMEKGKRLSKALQPDNVDTQAKAFTAQVAIFGGAFGFIGGDPVAMLQNVQNMASSGQGKLK